MRKSAILERYDCINDYPELRDSEKNTPLMIAVRENNIETIKTLLNAGANLNATNIHGDSVLSMSYSNVVTELLINAGAELGEKDKTTTLHEAVIQKAHALVKLLIESGADINEQLLGPDHRKTKDVEGYTPLMLAVEIGTPDIIKCILAAKPNIHLKNKKGETAFLLSCHVIYTRLLVALGANIQEKDNNGMNKLMKMMLNSKTFNISHFTYLLELGVDRDVKSDGWTLLMLAGATCNTFKPELLIAGHSAISYLLEVRPNVDEKNQYKATAFFIAAMTYNISSLYCFIRFMLDRTTYGSINHTDFTNKKDCINERNINDSTILMCLANQGYSEGLKLLAPSCFKEEHDKVWGNFLLSAAVNNRRSEHLQNHIKDKCLEKIWDKMLDVIVEIDAQNVNGWTALMFAALSRNTSMIRYLLEKGANIELKNIQEETAIDIAKRCGHTEIIDLLKPKTNLFSNNLSTSQQLPLVPGSLLPNSGLFPAHDDLPMLSVFIEKQNVLGKNIVRLAKTKRPYWEILSTRLQVDPSESRKELCSIQMELRRELNRILSEGHTNLITAIKSASLRGLLNKEEAKICFNINEAANEAKHETDDLNLTPLPGLH